MIDGKMSDWPRFRQSQVDSHASATVASGARPRQLPLEINKSGVHISLFTVIATFGSAQDVTADELRIESLFPADTATEALFRAAAGH